LYVFLMLLFFLNVVYTSQIRQNYTSHILLIIFVIYFKQKQQPRRQEEERIGRIQLSWNIPISSLVAQYKILKLQCKVSNDSKSTSLSRNS
jgi:hypothetical protein